MNTANIGWLFYRDYFKDIDGDFTHKSKAITDKKLADYKIPDYENVIDELVRIPLKTSYPGLLIGSGYQHDIKSESAFKVGFYFDYSTGLPVIPGSSVKGLLRSAFPFHQKDLGVEFRQSRIDYINRLLKDDLKIIEIDLQAEQIEKLEREIFVGIYNNENVELSERDLFLDAFPAKSFEHNGKFLASDYITHHEHPLKNPNPVMFLKVLSEVEFVFNFRLKNSKEIKELNADSKRRFFQQILLDLGIGAKTNVGYGQFILSQEEKEKLEKEKQLNDQKRLQGKFLRDQALREASKSEADKRVIAKALLECSVKKVEAGKNGYTFFEFDWDKTIIVKRKTQKLSMKLKVGDRVELEIIENYNGNEVVFGKDVKKL